METNNPDLLNFKMKFYAQYFGQKIVRSIYPEQRLNLTSVNADYFKFPNLIINSSCLELKSIENITDEDIRYIIDIAVASYMHRTKEDITYKLIERYKEEIRRQLHNFDNTNSFLLDFLRSKGYAVPFMEYSIEDLVKMNFIKII